MSGHEIHYKHANVSGAAVFIIKGKQPHYMPGKDLSFPGG